MVGLHTYEFLNAVINIFGIYIKLSFLKLAATLLSDTAMNINATMTTDDGNDRRFWLKNESLT